MPWLCHLDPGTKQQAAEIMHLKANMHAESFDLHDWKTHNTEEFSQHSYMLSQNLN